MKRLFLMACFLVVLLAQAATPKTKRLMADDYRIMVISDMHLLAPELYDNGESARRLAQNDMKLVLESDMAMKHIVDHAIAARPHLLLITGDMTLNGSRASHQRLATHLARLAQADVRTLVIPGNHDVSNPNARAYLGAKATAAATITREEFAQLYAPYGYGVDAMRDPASLSYACEPLPGLVVLGIDSNRDEENHLRARGDAADSYHNGGRVKPQTLQWIHQQASQAHAQGKTVIAMMHHHLLEHIDGEAKFLPNYIIANHDEVARCLDECGVHAVFTGHLHITDAVTDGTITDIATGSASMYPMPLRMAVINQQRDSMCIDTQWLDLPEPIRQQAQAQLEHTVPILAGVIANRLWTRLEPQMGQMKQMLAMQGVDTVALPQTAQQAADLMIRHMREPLTQSLLTVTRGGEDPKQAPAIIQAIKQGVQGMVDELMPTQAHNMGPFLIENLFPRVEPMMHSALEDRNHVNTPYESTTPDHSFRLRIKN